MGLVRLGTQICTAEPLEPLPSYKKGDKQIVVITGHITIVNYAQNFIQHPAVKLNSIFR